MTEDGGARIPFQSDRRWPGCTVGDSERNKMIASCQGGNSLWGLHANPDGGRWQCSKIILNRYHLRVQASERLSRPAIPFHKTMQNSVSMTPRPLRQCINEHYRVSLSFCFADKASRLRRLIYVNALSNHKQVLYPIAILSHSHNVAILCHSTGFEGTQCLEEHCPRCRSNQWAGL